MASLGCGQARPAGPSPRPDGGDGLGTTCPGCDRTLSRRILDTHQQVCPHCAHHFRLGAAARLRLLLDEGGWRERDAGLASTDPLAFRDRRRYPERLQAAMAATGLRDAAIAASGTVAGTAVEALAMEYRFLGGTLGVVVGEKIARAADRARAARRPLLLVCCSAGARMMEGALSLLQAAKVGAALGELDRAGVPCVSLLTDPTTGSVAASCAMLADVIVAEPGARIGVAPPSAIARTSTAPLPAGFQRAEFLLAHGQIDLVVDRRELKAALGRVLAWLAPSGAPPVARPAAPLDLSLD